MNKLVFIFCFLIQPNSGYSGNRIIKKCADIVSLPVGNFDKVLSRFSKFEGYTRHYAEPERFYEVLTLLKRSHLGGQEKASSFCNEWSGISGRTASCQRHVEEMTELIYRKAYLILEKAFKFRIFKMLVENKKSL